MAQEKFLIEDCYLTIDKPKFKRKRICTRKNSLLRILLTSACMSGLSLIGAYAITTLKNKEEDTIEYSSLLSCSFSFFASAIGMCCEKAYKNLNTKTRYRLPEDYEDDFSF